MKKLIFVLGVVLAQNIFGQDTIYKKNGSVIASKILEITPTVVKFKKFENLSGPVYSELISELWYIRFKNGTVDTLGRLNVIAEKDLNIIRPETSKVQAQVIKSRYPYNLINESELLFEIQNLPPSPQKTKMLREYANLKDYKRTQYSSCVLGWTVGFGVPIVVTYYSLSSSIGYDPVRTIVIGALAGAVIRTMGQVVFKVNKNKRLNSKRLIIEMFNDLN